ncbi:MAG: hypothetical protein JO111_02700 [Caulobacteraceae bacterium]|nr:hypothetical protein [Caulobacteraceae bacterium]
MKSRAALAGMSLSEYLLAQLRASAEILTPDEMRERLTSRTRVDANPSPAAIIRRERESR